MQPRTSQTTLQGSQGTAGSLQKPDNPHNSRLASIDIYRGLVMFLMLAEVLRLHQLAEVDFAMQPFRWLAEQGFWRWLAIHTTHVEWVGCSLHDLIQPSFSFLVGVALPFSLLARVKRQESLASSLFHAWWRSVVLIGLGIFLRSLATAHTDFRFDDTLTQIGLGYFFLFLISLGPTWLTWLSLLVILLGYWAAFVGYPLPNRDWDPSQHGIPADWKHHFTGLAAHWNKNANFASDFDRWFLNLFPRSAPFVFQRGGYATLSFIPTLATMLMGLIAGRWLLTEGSSRKRMIRLFLLGLVSLTLAWGIDGLGLCPIVKRIWTPTWVLWSGGICCCWLLVLHAICDVAGHDGWGFFWKVIGANSIAAYVMEWTTKEWVAIQFKKHLGWDVTTSSLGPELAQAGIGFATLLVFWWVLYWMYRRKIFLKV